MRSGPLEKQFPPVEMATYKSELDRRAVATVWVGRLTKLTTEESLKDFFKDFMSDITTIHLKPGERKGDQYAFVNFKSLGKAHQAQQELNMRPIDDCRSVLLRVNEELDQEHFRKQYAITEQPMLQGELAPRHMVDMTLVYGQPGIGQPAIGPYPQPVSTPTMMYPPHGAALTRSPMVPPGMQMHMGGQAMPAHMPLDYHQEMIMAPPTGPPAPPPLPPPPQPMFHNNRSVDMPHPRRAKEPIPGANAAATIWLGRLPIYCEPDHIRPHFEKFEAYILDIRVRTNKKLQSCYAFVDFSSVEAAKAASNHARKVEMCGGNPTVKLYDGKQTSVNGGQDQGTPLNNPNEFIADSSQTPADLRTGGEVSPSSREYIWIGSLPSNTERSDVSAAFMNFQNDIIDIRVRTNKKRQSCYAFVDFRTSAAARQAFVEAKSQLILGVKPTWKLTAGKETDLTPGGEGLSFMNEVNGGDKGAVCDMGYDVEWPPLVSEGPERDIGGYQGSNMHGSSAPIMHPMDVVVSGGALSGPDSLTMQMRAMSLPNDAATTFFQSQEMSKQLFVFLEQHLFDFLERQFTPEMRLTLQQNNTSLCWDNGKAVITGVNSGHARMLAQSILDSVTELEVAVDKVEWLTWMTMLPGSKLPLEWLFLTMNIHDVCPIGEENGEKRTIRLLGFREAVQLAAGHLETLRKYCLHLPWPQIELLMTVYPGLPQSLAQMYNVFLLGWTEGSSYLFFTTTSLNSQPLIPSAVATVKSNLSSYCTRKLSLQLALIPSARKQLRLNKLARSVLLTHDSPKDDAVDDQVNCTLSALHSTHLEAAHNLLTSPAVEETISATADEIDRIIQSGTVQQLILGHGVYIVEDKKRDSFIVTGLIKEDVAWAVAALADAVTGHVVSVMPPGQDSTLWLAAVLRNKLDPELFELIGKVQTMTGVEVNVAGECVELRGNNKQVADAKEQLSNILQGITSRTFSFVLSDRLVAVLERTVLDPLAREHKLLCQVTQSPVDQHNHRRGWPGPLAELEVHLVGNDSSLFQGLITLKGHGHCEEAIELSPEEQYNLSDPSNLGYFKRVEKELNIVLEKDPSRNLLWIAATNRQALARAQASVADLCQGMSIQSKSFALPECHAAFLQRRCLSQLKKASICECDLQFDKLPPDTSTGELLSKLVLQGNAFAVDDTLKAASSILRNTSTMSVHVRAPSSLCPLLAHAWSSIVESIEMRFDVSITNGSPHPSVSTLDGPSFYEGATVDLSDSGVEVVLGQNIELSNLSLDITSVNQTAQQQAAAALLDVTQSLVRESFQISVADAEQLSRRLRISVDAIFKLCKVSAGVSLANNTMVIVAKSSFAVQKAKAEILEWLHDGHNLAEVDIDLSDDPLAARILLTQNWEQTLLALGNNIHAAKVPGNSPVVRLTAEEAAVEKASEVLKQRLTTIGNSLTESQIPIVLAMLPALLMPAFRQKLLLSEDELPIQWLYSAEEVQSYIARVKPTLQSKLNGNNKWPDSKLLGVTASTNGHPPFVLKLRGTHSAIVTATSRLERLLQTARDKKESVLKKLDVEEIEKLAFDKMVDVELQDADGACAKVVSYGLPSALKQFWNEVDVAKEAQ